MRLLALNVPALLFFSLICGSSLRANELGSAPAVAPLAAATAATTAKPAAAVAPLGAVKAGTVAPLGKPKFALKLGVAAPGVGGNAPDRAAEVKRLISAYDNLALQYYYLLTMAKTPEEKAAIVAKHEPSEKIVRSFARLLAHLVSVDPKDEPALDALLFLNKYVGLPEVDAILAGTAIKSGDYSAPQLEPLVLLLEFHADHEKLAGVLKSLPNGGDTNDFLLGVFQKTHCPEVRAAAGIRLVNTLQQMDRNEPAETLAAAMAEDRYLDGVPITPRPDGPTAREWAEGKLRELRLLGIGKVLPEVGGNTLDGNSATISDYRGKVVVLSVWTTWCGPCRASIPHELEMAKRLADKPFALLSVSCDAEQETLTEFLKETPMPWDHWWVGMDGEFSKTLNIHAFPTVIVLDGEGVIRHKNIKGEELDEAVDALLAEVEGKTDKQN